MTICAEAAPRVLGSGKPLGAGKPHQIRAVLEILVAWERAIPVQDDDPGGPALVPSKEPPLLPLLRIVREPVADFERAMVDAEVHAMACEHERFP